VFARSTPDPDLDGHARRLRHAGVRARSRRDSLAGLRDDPNAAICLMGEEVAFTAYGSASVIREQLDAAPRIAALALRVDRVQDHLADGRTEMLDGARWRRLDPAIAEAEAAILTELQALVRE